MFLYGPYALELLRVALLCLTAEKYNLGAWTTLLPKFSPLLVPVSVSIGSCVIAITSTAVIFQVRCLRLRVDEQSWRHRRTGTDNFGRCVTHYM